MKFTWRWTLNFEACNFLTSKQWKREPIALYGHRKASLNYHARNFSSLYWISLRSDKGSFAKHVICYWQLKYRTHVENLIEAFVWINVRDPKAPLFVLAKCLFVLKLRWFIYYASWTILGRRSVSSPRLVFGSGWQLSYFYRYFYRLGQSSI